MVLFASYSGEFGGAERLLLDFTAALQMPLALACPEGRFAQAARERGLLVHPLAHRRLNLRARPSDRALAALRLAAHRRELQGVIREHRPQGLVAWGMRSAIAALLGPRFPCPVIFQHNDLIPGQATGRLVRLAAARSTLTIALSETIARDLDPDRALGARVAVIRPGVDVARFDPDAPRADPPEVLVLGSITPWKRPELALDACALARRAHPGLRLRVVGAPFADDGPALLVELRRRAAALGFAELPGPSTDPAAELGRAYCLLHCAEHEPFGMAVLEALAAARPVVVPGAGGPAEIVDASCALTYPAGDARAAADALGVLLADPAQAAQLGQAGRERARREFDLGRAQERYAAVLTAALAA